MTGRREFILKLVPVAGAIAAGSFAGLPREALADIPAMTEDDKVGVSLGFRLHTEKVDQKKFPKHTNEQNCGKCSLYSVPAAATAKCNLFGKLVPKTGWCNGYVARA
jgi:hypothetical protein